jgi:hypothetical protein
VNAEAHERTFSEAFAQWRLQQVVDQSWLSFLIAETPVRSKKKRSES